MKDQSFEAWLSEMKADFYNLGIGDEWHNIEGAIARAYDYGKLEGIDLCFKIKVD